MYMADRYCQGWICHCIVSSLAIGSETLGQWCHDQQRCSEGVAAQMWSLQLVPARSFKAAGLRMKVQAMHEASRSSHKSRKATACMQCIPATTSAHVCASCQLDPVLPFPRYGVRGFWARDAKPVVLTSDKIDGIHLTGGSNSSTHTHTHTHTHTTPNKTPTTTAAPWQPPIRPAGPWLLCLGNSSSSWPQALDYRCGGGLLKASPQCCLSACASFNGLLLLVV